MDFLREGKLPAVRLLRNPMFVAGRGKTPRPEVFFNSRLSEVSKVDGTQLGEILAFLSAYDEGSFSAASVVLGRDVSVISKRLSSLEGRLGVRLLERTTRRLSPTEAGTLFYRRMRSALSMMDEATVEASRSNEVASGLLRIALPVTFGQKWINPMLPTFLAAWPNVTIEADYSDRFVDLVHERFDVGIRLGELADNRLVARRLAANDRIAVASPAYVERRGLPLMPKDLASHSCLPNPRLEGFPDWGFRKGNVISSVRPQGRLTANDSTSLVAAAVAGVGITVIARWLIADEISSGKLVRVLEDWTFEHSGGIHFVRPSARYTTLKIRVFTDWLVDMFAVPPWGA